MTGRIPVNSSGGLISMGHPLGPTGLGQIAEILWQMRRTAGSRQIPQDVHVALAHMVGAGGVCDPYSPPLIFGDFQALEGLCVSFDFYSLVQSIMAKFKGPRRIQAWQCALACSAALALLVSLWFAPWQVRHDGPTPVHQSRPLQGSNRTTEEIALPTAQPLVAPTSEAGSLPSAPAPQTPEQPHTSATSEEPTEVLDTQAMQGLVTHLEAARGNPEEHLDTRAMDRLLARLESADKTGLPTPPRSKVARKRGTRVLPRTVGHGAPGSVSPPRDDAAPLSSAAGMQFPAASQ